MVRRIDPSLLFLAGGLLAGMMVGLLWVRPGSLQSLVDWPSLFGAPAVDQALALGALAPDFKLQGLDGQVKSLAGFRGQAVLINFWASWCSPCRLEMPEIQAAYDQFRPDLVVLAVNYDEPLQTVADFTARLGLGFDILLDPAGKIQDLYQVYAYPTSYFVDREGMIRAIHVGILSTNQLEGYLEKIGIGK